MNLLVRIRNLLIVTAVFLAGWFALGFFEIVPTYILPSVGETFSKIKSSLADSNFTPHVVATLVTVFIGLLIGALFGFFAGALCGSSRRINAFLMPFIVGVQSVPLVAFAPLLLLVFGQSQYSRIVVVALVTCFPILASTAAGFSGEQRTFRRLFLSFGASHFQTWTKLRIPLALPYFVNGLKSALPLAWVGALVSEFLGTNVGLGFVLQSSGAIFDTGMVFAVIVILAFFGIVSFLALEILEDAYVKRFRIDL